MFTPSYAQENNAVEGLEIETTDSNDDEVSFAIIERVPIYRGCDGRLNNEALKKCMNQAIKLHISGNFNKNVIKELNLPTGEVKISCFFKIGKKGNIIEIKIRAPHPDLEKEAIRVLKLIPKMKKPGYQKGKPVIVPYYLPIKFSVEDNKRTKASIAADLETTPERYPLYKNCDETLGNEAAKQCTIKKIKNFIKLSFNVEMADKLFPLDKSTKFQVDFIINKKGKAEKITAKAYKKEIAAEAIRVLKRLPKFKKPGYSNGKAVNVPFSLMMTIHF